jgi:hypothetical protein
MMTKWFKKRGSQLLGIGSINMYWGYEYTPKQQKVCCGVFYKAHAENINEGLWANKRVTHF